MTTRAEQRQQFLQSGDWRDATLHALKQDASARCYYRLHGGPKPAVLMDAPVAEGSIQLFVEIAHHLLALGVSAPTIYASDSTQGFCLLEDFGDETFSRLIDSGFDELELYRLAVDCLVALQGYPENTNIQVPSYREHYVSDAMLFCQWGYPQLCGEQCPKPVADEFRDAWHKVLRALSDSPSVLMLRDFHVDNAMLLRNRDGVKRCGLLDFQDARIGHSIYDLVSLLEDARRDVDKRVREDCLAYFRKHHQSNEKTFSSDYAVIAVQRHLRVIAIFTRLTMRDQKHQYLAHLSRVSRLLLHHLEHPAVASVCDWFREYCPQINNVAELLAANKPG